MTKPTHQRLDGAELEPVVANGTNIRS